MGDAMPPDTNLLPFTTKRRPEFLPLAEEYFALRVVNVEPAGVISVCGIDVSKPRFLGLQHSDAGSVVALEDVTNIPRFDTEGLR